MKLNNLEERTGEEWVPLINMEWIIVSLLVILVVLYFTWVLINNIKQRKHYMSFLEGLDLTGFPIVTMSNNGTKMNFVLDTGSVHSLINKDIVESLIYNETSYVVTISGIDDKHREDEPAITMELSYKDKTVRGMFVMTDLSSIFTSVKKETGVQLHGLLGSDFFKQNKYIIDFNEMVAYSKKI